MSTRERVEALIAMVEQGRFVEAIEEFLSRSRATAITRESTGAASRENYADDATMQENLDPPRRGRDVLVSGERQVLQSFAEGRTLPVDAWLVDGDRAVIHWVFEFVGRDGRGFRQDELALQRWVGDRIVEERYYYDPAQRKRGLTGADPGASS